MGKSVDKTKLEFGAHPPVWCNALSVEEEETIKEIYKFFVVNTPCKDVSAMSVPISSYGWTEDTPPKDGYLQKRICEAAGLVKDSNLFIGNEREDMKALFTAAAMDESFTDKYTENRIAILINGNLLMELFRNIRNSFAHCRFCLKKVEGDMIFAMENGAVNGSTCEIKSRMIIKKSTFEEWIRIIKNEAATEKALLKAEQEKLKQDIIATVSNEEVRSIAQLATLIGTEENVINSFNKNNKGIIEYSRHEKKWVLSAPEGAE